MPEGERDTFAEFQRNTSGVAGVITMIRKRSDELSAEDVTLPLDLVFIDADHSYDAVKGDVVKVRGWIRDGGTLAFHDAIFFEGVSRVIGEVLATGQWQLAGKVDNLVWLTKVRAFAHPMARS
jgi:predicted O-methyltransferase YrrM